MKKKCEMKMDLSKLKNKQWYSFQGFIRRVENKGQVFRIEFFGLQANKRTDLIEITDILK